MTDVVSGPPITLPAVRVGAASALTAGLAITTIQPDWRVPQWELIALGVVLALAAAAAWSCTRAPATKLLTLWSVITLAAVVAWSVVATVGPPTDAPFTPAAVTALLLLAAGEAERRSCAVTDVPLWWPALALLAGITAFGVWLVIDDVPGAVATGLSVLVAAAPGATRLCAPSALLLGRRRAVRLKLTLGGSTPALASRIDTLVLAPHGTLTTGDMRVVSVRPIEPDHERNLRWFAGALSQAREDRVSRAVARIAQGRGRLTDVQNEAAGIRGTVDRHPVRVGEPDWLRIPADDDLWTVLAVEVDGRGLGSLVVAEQLRDDAAEQVVALRQLGVEPVFVSDDTAARAHHLAAECGLAEARLTREGADTTSVVAHLRSAGNLVAVIGPDAAGSDLHIGQRATGAAGIGAPDDAVGHAVDGLRLARSIDSRARRGLRAAGALAVVGIGLAAAGILTPLLASAWAVASAVVVVAAAAPSGS
ncbi:hypothetical protein [Aeromicrobium sp. CF3.5]|uniref:hypothetical protein n=1 Tax=Aeromicrobium sp. CF3.5 TaxID=3373078 RepID=UPI003EE528F9